MVKPDKKFTEWADKIKEILETENNSKIDSLPEKCRWLKYWSEKLEKENDCRYKEFETTKKTLLGNVADVLNTHYSSYLKKAETHKKGTKVRLREILRYVYSYSNYVHGCYLIAQKKSTTEKILKKFWEKYQTELISYFDKIEDYQIGWLARLVKQSENIGLVISDDLTSNIVERKPIDAILVEKCKNRLEEAIKNLKNHETITALVIADQTLELFLKDLCIRWECDYSVTNDRGKKFNKWGLPDYVGYLSEIGQIEEKYKVDFYHFHDWRNCAQHHGLEPSKRCVKTVISKISDFINENI